MAKEDPRPLVVHVVHRFDTGGLENGVVNLINHMPEQAYRHRVLALTEVTSFSQRLRRPDVECLALGKRPGHGARLYPRVFRLLRQWRPAVVHTRNLGPLEFQVAALLAGVPVRIHGEHGRELADVDGTNRHQQRLRRLYSPFVHRFVAVSQDLRRYLVDRVGIAAERVDQIYNGVDTARFAPAESGSGTESVPGWPFDERGWYVGTVGRMQGVKNAALLANAFVRALERTPAARARLRLVMVGDGPERQACQSALDRAGVGDLAWLPGDRVDVPALMRRLDCFVLPSLAEGISNTILEAMATGLPVIATRVGGNGEIVKDGETGVLVPSGDVESMATAILDMATGASKAQDMGRRGRHEALDRFSLDSMVRSYMRLYDQQTQKSPDRHRSP